MKTSVNPIQVLIDHASGRVHHLCLVSCPDPVVGHDSRDPDCPVCCAIDAVVQPTPLTIEEISEHGASSAYYDDVPSLVKVPFAGLVKFVRRIEEAHGIGSLGASETGDAA